MRKRVDDSPTSGFKVGDRVKSDAHPHLSGQFQNQTGTVIDIGTGTTSARWIQVDLDEVASPSNEIGWGFAPERLTIIDEAPTDEEIADLFGLAPKCPTCGK